MFCTHCGKEIEDDATYCPFCGKTTDAPIETGKDKETKKEYALSSMITGILSLIIPLINLPLSIIAIVLSKKDESNSYSKVGKITGIIGLVLSILSIFFFIIWIIAIAIGSRHEPYLYIGFNGII